MGNVGRPKLEISRTRTVTIRVTNFEFEKISKIAEKKKLSKTEAILKGIELLERDKPKKFKNLHKKIVRTKFGDVDADIVEFL